MQCIAGCKYLTNHFVCSCYADACRVSNVEQTIQFNPICYDFVFFGCVWFFFSHAVVVAVDVEVVLSLPHSVSLFFFGSSLHARLLVFWFLQLHILSWFNKNRAQWWYCIVADVSNLLLFCTLIRYSYMIDMSTLSIMCLLYSLFFVIEQVIYCTKTVKEISNLLTVKKKRAN